MKILVLNYEYPPLGGGAANATACLLHAYRGRSDLEIDLVTSSTGKARTENLSENITIHFLDIGKRGNPHYQTNRELLTYAWRARNYAKTLLGKRKYDLCHAFFGIPCGYVARQLGLPYIVSLRGSDVPFYNERFKYLDLLFFKRLSVKIWRDASCVVANSRGLRELALESAPNQRIDVIYNGVDADLFRPGKQREGKDLRVICVSRLIARKGLEFLIKAMREFRDADVTLELAGKGNMEERLRQMAERLGVERSVRFSGFVEHDRITKLYQESDLFILPSLNEGMSNTVLEAMACGLPIAITDTGGAAELLQDGGNGFLIGKQSVSDIVDALRRYMENRDLLKEHGAQSRKIAESMTWDKMASDYLKLYVKAAQAPESQAFSRRF